VIEKLRGLRLTPAAELVEAAVEETLTYYAFPEEHWRRIRTNNPLERILREIRRRTRVDHPPAGGRGANMRDALSIHAYLKMAWSPFRWQPHHKHVTIQAKLSQNTIGADYFPKYNSSITALVCAMFARLDAPNTIDSTFFWRATYSIASRGRNAPEASTDIATALN
jgi:hypothetical protein